MAQMQDLYIKLDVLETLVKGIKAKGEKGIAITISVSDETNNYGQNVSSWVSQKKEDREKPKYYVGNGKVFWNNGFIKNAEKQDNSNTPQHSAMGGNAEPDDLPF